MTLGNSTTTTYSYYAFSSQGGRLSNLTATKGGTTLQNFTYTYGNTGNILQIVDAVLNETTTYGYDDLDRLNLVSGAETNDPEYDPVTGNISSMNGYAYTYSAAHPHAVINNGNGGTYGYDNNGNMSSRTINGVAYTLGYDAENRLVTVSGGMTANFLYDGDGNRVKATVGSTIIAYIGVHAEYNATTGEMTRYFLVGSKRVAMEVVPAGQTNGPINYLLQDHLGSTHVVILSNGVVERKTYSAWGEGRSGSVSTHYQFTGQISEMETIGLYFYNARFYDPSLGRFVSADTLIPQPGNPMAWDRYAYALNNPLRYTDPSGHFTEEAIRNYLYYFYQDEWREVWKTWRADIEFWSMLRTAQAGDTIYGAACAECWKGQYSGFLYQLTGEGNTSLTGITPLTYGDVTFGSSSTMLEDIQSGKPMSMNYYGQTISMYMFDWYGIIRGLGGTQFPEFFSRNSRGKIIIEDPQPKTWWNTFAKDDKANFYYALASAGIGYLITQSLPVAVGVGILTYLLQPSAIVDAYNVEPGDVYIHQGPLFINLQKPGQTEWIVEVMGWEW